MKNIHVLVENKHIKNVGDLVKDQYTDIHIFTKNDGKEYGKTTTKLNIYITDEEISGLENNIWVYNNGRVFLWQNTMALVSSNKPRKIILTTDQELIKDGVQEISDEFLEWFVKNPSCEIIEVEKWVDYKLENDKEVPFFNYKIIIQKEEPKQENDYTALLKPVGTKQTAVEWLAQKFEELLVKLDFNEISEEDYLEEWKNIIIISKEMEKSQRGHTEEEN